VEFDIILEEVFTHAFASQVKNTTLGDSIQTFVNNTFVTGEFVTTLQNISAAAIAADQNRTYDNDTLLSAVGNLNKTAASGNMEIYVTITTNAPTSNPSTYPSENISEQPSQNSVINHPKN
jgi:hypothetical protein